MTLNEEIINDFAEAIKKSILNVFKNNDNLFNNDSFDNTIKDKKPKVHIKNTDTNKDIVAPVNTNQSFINNELEEDTIKDNLMQENSEKLQLSDIVEKLKTDKNILLDWWQPYKRQFKSGDIVYIKSKNKFGIFIQPSVKDNKVRVRLMRHNDKNAVYTVDWLFSIDDMELVKHKNRVSRKFIENDLTFKLK